MNISIEVDDEAWTVVPDLEAMVRRAAREVLKDEDRAVTLVFTDDKTVAELNSRFRGKPTPTNVLSFPYTDDLVMPPGETRPLGDIILAFGTVEREALEQGKPLAAHAGHLVIHGLLHLLGHDHETDEDSGRMETLEIAHLKNLDIENPYDRP